MLSAIHIHDLNSTFIGCLKKSDDCAKASVWMKSQLESRTNYHSLDSFIMKTAMLFSPYSTGLSQFRIFELCLGKLEWQGLINETWMSTPTTFNEIATFTLDEMGWKWQKLALLRALVNYLAFTGTCSGSTSVESIVIIKWIKMTNSHNCVITTNTSKYKGL